MLLSKYVERKVTWIWPWTVLQLLDIWWDGIELIKFNKQIGNNFAKIINANVSSRPCQTSEMEPFPPVVTCFRGELRTLSKIWDGTFRKNSHKQKAVHYFCKKLHLVLEGSKHASELASKVKDVSFLNRFKFQTTFY